MSTQSRAYTSRCYLPLQGQMGTFWNSSQTVGIIKCPGTELICFSSCWAAGPMFVTPKRYVALEEVWGRMALSLAFCKLTFRKEYQKGVLLAMPAVREIPEYYFFTLLYSRDLYPAWSTEREINMNLPTCFITPGAQKHSWYLLVPLTSPCAATDPYLQTKNICVGMLSTLFDPFLWTPQSGIVLGAAEKTILLALLGVFLFLACNRKYFTWDLFSSATIELWSCSFVVVDLLYQLKELSKHTSFVNLTNGKKEKRTNPTSQDAKKMTFIFSLVHFQTCKHLC